ncbi:DUF6326 family protein [Actinoplanes philippinensis]|uniref:DUF6326 family protein n=1 Tax=Actinoplanes philippinensis TaxID=35752 RepID=UPI0033FC9843
MPRSRISAGHLADTEVDVKAVLNGLWIATMLVFAYIDIFGLHRADVIDGVLAGEMSGAGLPIHQWLLLLTTVYVMAPALMPVVSLTAPARVGRPANIVAGLLYAVTAALTVIGETWLH